MLWQDVMFMILKIVHPLTQMSEKKCNVIQLLLMVIHLWLASSSGGRAHDWNRIYLAKDKPNRGPSWYY
jgi:hypothetical protein